MVTVLYTANEVDCHTWIENEIGSNDVVSLDCEMLSDSKRIEVVILATRLAVLIVHYSFFRPCIFPHPLAIVAQGCLGRLISRPDITLVGVGLRDDMNLVYSTLSPPFAIPASFGGFDFPNRLREAVRKGAPMPEGAVTPVAMANASAPKAELCDLCSVVSFIMKYDRKALPHTPPHGLQSMIELFYPRIQKWKPKDFYRGGFQSKQSLFKWHNQPLTAWQLHYCAMDGWAGRAIFDALELIYKKSVLTMFDIALLKLNDNASSDVAVASKPLLIAMKNDLYVLTQQDCAVTSSLIVVGESGVAIKSDSSVVKNYAVMPNPGAARASHMHMFKTQMCRHFQSTGSCPLKERCRFAHGANELVVYKAAELEMT